MRHDPASAAVVVMLRGLKMYGMAQAVGDLIEQGAPAFDAAVPILSQLLKAEIAELKQQAKERMHDRAALFTITQKLRALNVRLEELQRNLHQ